MASFFLGLQIIVACGEHRVGHNLTGQMDRVKPDPKRVGMLPNSIAVDLGCYANWGSNGAVDAQPWILSIHPHSGSAPNYDTQGDER